MPSENNTPLRYSQQSFRPEAVEAYATRQAGEPWDSKRRFENWVVAGLTLLAGAAVIFVFGGGR
jgi:hypothetical protein